MKGGDFMKTFAWFILLQVAVMAISAALVFILINFMPMELVYFVTVPVSMTIGWFGTKAIFKLMK